jgi:hypothetical protein
MPNLQHFFLYCVLFFTVEGVQIVGSMNLKLLCTKHCLYVLYTSYSNILRGI